MKTKKELRGEFSAVLKKAYIQKESVDNVKDKKFTDPTGYEFLESWTWSWFEKQLKVKDDEVLKKVENLDKEMVDGVGWNRMHELALDILDSLKGKRRAIK